MTRRRLDVAVFELGLAESRERAKALIMAGGVLVNGQRAARPADMVDIMSEITVRAEERYVSRGGYKLEKALDFFGVSPAGAVCIDCGASTGGFTDVLLQRGAEKVYAVDVGYGQLAWRLRCEARVVVLERTNIRYITREQIPVPPRLAVIDVSFISLGLVLLPVKEVLLPGAQLICLIKPQFEAGREKVGKKGVVRDIRTHVEVLEAFRENADAAGLAVRGVTFSPIRGPQGNIEFLGYLTLGGSPAALDIERVAREAHGALDGDGGVRR